MTAEKKQLHLRAFLDGLHDGVPIGLGYFAVAFSLGISAHSAGLTAFQGFVASFLTIASAGEYAAFCSIAAGATYLEVALVTLTTNLRYLLMSASLSQKVPEYTPMIHRFLMSDCITDEIFGICIARSGPFSPCYSYGAFVASVPAWSVGTALGILLGNLLPDRLVMALSVALYGMFIAIIIPPIKQNRIIGGIIIVSFALSYLFRLPQIPYIGAWSDGTKTIFLTIAISLAAALLFPVKGGDSDE